MLLSSMAPFTSAQLYKCVGIDGNVDFTDRPCPTAQDGAANGDDDGAIDMGSLPPINSANTPTSIIQQQYPRATPALRETQDSERTAKKQAPKEPAVSCDRLRADYATLSRMTKCKASSLAAKYGTCAAVVDGSGNRYKAIQQEKYVKQLKRTIDQRC